MKLIDTLNEALGVPTSIIDTANEIYDRFDLNNINYKLLYNIGDSISINNSYPKVIKGDFKIGDEIYTRVMYSFLVSPHPNTDEVVLGSIAVESNIEVVGVGKVQNNQDETIKILFSFLCPGDDGTPNISDKAIKEGIKKFFMMNKEKLISNLTHELKHVYDGTKKRSENITDLSKYVVHKNFIGWNVTPISDFCYSLYFMSVTETLVRPSELASLIQTKNITKKDFLTFLKDSDTYKELSKIKNMTYDDFYNDLFNYINEIKGYYRGNEYKVNNKSDKEIVDMFLTDIRKLLQNEMIGYIYRNIIGNKTNDTLSLFSDINQIIFLNKVSEKIMKYKNNKDFYSNEINYNAKKADFVIRKLAKLYAITK